MGKNKKSNKKVAKQLSNNNKKGGTANVFKVAGAKSLKIKNKAKAVSGQLKNLEPKGAEKSVQLNKQLTELRDTITIAKKPATPKQNNKKQRNRKNKGKKAEDPKKVTEGVDALQV